MPHILESMSKGLKNFLRHTLDKKIDVTRFGKSGMVECHGYRFKVDGCTLEGDTVVTITGAQMLYGICHHDGCLTEMWSKRFSYIFELKLVMDIRDKTRYCKEHRGGV